MYYNRHNCNNLKEPVVIMMSSTYPEKLRQSKSLLAKYLTEARYQQLKNKQTSQGYTFAQAIQSNIDNLDSGIGIYAGDAESYQTFAAVMMPIIEDYHQVKLNQAQQQDFDASGKHWDMPDDSDEYILSTRIRTARNLAATPFGGALTAKQRGQVEQQIVEALNELDGELAGSYHALTAMSEKQQQALVEQHYLFKQGDRFLASAGLNNDWPNHRGIYFNAEKTFLVWVNEEDQLRIISMQQGGNIQQVFSRLKQAVQQLSQRLDFAIDKQLGVLSSCPTNIGTGIRASVHIRLPKLAANQEQLQALAKQYHLQVRGQHGEHSESVEPIFDISNKRRLGLSEVECIDDLVSGVQAIIATEKAL